MAFTAEELSNINNSVLETYLDKGTVFKQNVQNKPMLASFNAKAESFPGGREFISFAVKSGQGGLQLQGYSGDDQVRYGNIANTKRPRFPWREHHIGLTVTHTELKNEGVDVIEDGSDQSTREMGGREEHVLAKLLDEKMDSMGEDYAISLDLLIHGDGSVDPKALAGIRSLILDNPGSGSTGGLSRVAHPWWANRAATTAFAAAGGQGPITSTPANGGALIEFLDKELRQLRRRSGGTAKMEFFAGSDFIDAYKKEMRANGEYSNTGWSNGNVDGSMPDPKHAGTQFVYDPSLDDLGFAKRCYALDMSKKGIRLFYMDGNRMKKHKPARPYDRYVMYNGITTTAVLGARRLNSSAVYDIV
jgi:hypothetical protein